MAKARKMISATVFPADGARQIAGDNIVLVEPAPIPHLVEKLEDGKVRHWFGVPFEFVEQVSEIELAAAGLGPKVKT